MRRTLYVLAAAGALLVAGCGAAKEAATEPEQAPVEFVRATGQMSPRTHLFADPIDLRVDVVVNRNQLDPARISIKSSFKPYAEVGETTVARRDAGDLTHLRFDTQVRCLEFECLTQRINTITDPSAGAPRVFNFKPTDVLYADPDKQEPRLLRTIRWPQLETVSRINGQDATQVFGFPFRWDVFPLPTLSTSISPALLAALLLAAAALLLVLPVILVARRLRRKESELEEPEPEASPLERALELVEWSKARSGDERRAALEALADELDALEDEALATDARAAAWRPPFPSPEDATQVVVAVREAHGLAG